MTAKVRYSVDQLEAGTALAKIEVVQFFKLAAILPAYLFGTAYFAVTASETIGNKPI